MTEIMDGRTRARLASGRKVRVVQKKDQRSGALTEGVVQDILTKSPTHPHGIKVRLTSGIIGRVKEILPLACLFFFFLILIPFVLGPAPAGAIEGWGEITKIYSYDDLVIEKENSGCRISGTIINNSREFKDRVRVTIYAWNNFKELLWKTAVTIDGIEAKGEAAFEKKIRKCEEDNPYKLTFKIRD